MEAGAMKLLAASFAASLALIAGGFALIWKGLYW
jgi:hypothetical protein